MPYSFVHASSNSASVAEGELQPKSTHEDGLKELGSRLTSASDGQLRQFISKCCVNLVSELLEYREDVKENDHATDALRNSPPLAQEERPFLYVVRR